MRTPSSVPEAVLHLAHLQEGLVSTKQCKAAEMSDAHLEALVRSGLWERPHRGVYDIDPTRSGPADDLDRRRRRSVWTALLAYGPAAIAIGSGALALHGVLGLPAALTPEAAVPRGRERRNRPGLRLRQFDNGMATIEIAGRRVATVEWALAQAVPELGRAHAVAVMDSALHLGLVDRRGLERAHRLARGRRGVAKTHTWWEVADGRAESPLETFGRLECLDAGVPPDDLQISVVDSRGFFLGRGDMGWRLDNGRWLIAEMDGREWHEAPGALLYDRRRQNALMREAVVLRFTAADARIPGKIGATVRSHLLSLRPANLPSSQRPST